MCSRYNWPRWILAPSRSIKDARELPQNNISAGVPKAQRTNRDSSPGPLHSRMPGSCNRRVSRSVYPRCNGLIWIQALSLKDA
ncbi:hypothetical protein DBR19_07460 [Aeromonas sp. HMWF014]|nr:hypothetical protein DBR19_07460 [Aeromonas sp. HMWF014]